MKRLVVESTRSTEWIDVTEPVARAASELEGAPRAVLLFCPHTSAAVTINEGWDPAVAEDLDRALAALVPRIPYRHAEGNSPAHLLATLVGSSIHVLLDPDRHLQLGRWQRIFFCEFDGPRRRELWLQPLGG